MYLVLFLPPSVISGATFPLAVRAVTDRASDAAAHVGQLGGANMAGGVLGAVAAGFLLPVIGLENGVRATTALSLVAAWIAWVALAPARAQASRLVLAVAAGVAWVAASRLAPTRLPEDFLTRNGALVAAREGVQSNLAVSRAGGATILSSDHWWQGQDGKSHQIMAAHVPMLLHPSPRRVLVIGVGAGQTPARFPLYDITRLDAVDIDPVVFDLVREYFDAAWMDDPRVRIHAEDGRTYVQRTADRYDVISIEVGQLLRPGTGAFYTRDFYARARERLNEGGIVSQFVPLSFLTPDDFHDVVRTFVEAFPQSVLWFNRTEPLLIGTTGQALALRPDRLALLAQPGAVHDDLAFNLWGSRLQNDPAVFLSSYLLGPEALARVSERGSILTDDRPVLEYRAGAVVPEAQGQFPIEAEAARWLSPIAPVAPDVPRDIVERATAIRAQHMRELALRSAVRR
jgi:spermidine synthase